MSKDTNAKKVESTKKPPPKQAPDAAVQVDEVVALQSAQNALDNPLEASPKAMRAAHRTYGNQRVQRAVRRHNGGSRFLHRALQVNAPDDQYEQEADAMANSLSRSVAGSRAGGDNNPTSPSDTATSNIPIQTRGLTVSQPNDPMEQEAESVADALDSKASLVPPIAIGNNGGDTPNTSRSANGNGTVNQQLPLARTQRGVHRVVPTQLRGQVFNGSVQRSDNDLDDDGGLMMSHTDPQMVPPFGVENGNGAIQRAEGFGMDRSGGVHQNVEDSINRKRGSGEPLSAPIQSKMEGHLGSDLSDVRVHTDNESDSLNRSLQADAFTTGSDVFFRKDKYEPGSEGGQKLIAHELTHVVQQGAAPAKSPQRQESAEDDLALSPSTEPAFDLDSDVTAPATETAERARPKPITAPPISRHPSVPTSIMRYVTPVVSRSTSGLFIQRDDDDKKEEEAKVEKEKSEGKEKAQQKKSEKQGNKDEKSGKANEKKAAEVPAPAKPLTSIPAPKIKNQAVEKPEQTGKTNRDNLETPDMEGADLGMYGWPATKEMALPDWDDEVAKYEAFQSGDMEALNVDMSELEGHFIELNEPITVDDPAIRAQIINDALGGGLNGDSVSGFDQGMSTLLDSIPFAGQLASFGSFFKGPGEWFESTGEGFKNAAAEIGDAFKGMGEGSGWNRAASFLEFLIGILSMINNILQIISIIALVVLIVMAIIFGIGAVLAATLFFAAVGTSMMTWSTPFMILAAQIMAFIAIFIVYSNLLIRVLREIVIAFRIIDILYYESDPQKLMERQAKLAGHVSGLNSAAYENITPGIEDESEKEKDTDEESDEEIEDPEVSDPTIERVSRMSDEEEQDYRAGWAARYGVDTTATQARDQLMEEDMPPPPLAPEFMEDKEQDVVGRINDNAIAIIEIQRQQYGLSKQRVKAEGAIETTKNQEEILGNAQKGVQGDIAASDEHQKDIDTKLDKQDDLKGAATDTGKKGEQGQGTSVEAQGMAGIILKLLQPFLPALNKAGERVEDDQKEQTKQGADQGVEGADASTEAAQKGAAEADDRKQKTKQTKGQASQTHGELEATESMLGDKKDEATEGREELETMHAEIASTEESFEEEKQRLIMERSEAVGDAVTWMSDWRAARQQVLEELQEQLDEIKPEEEESDEDEFGEEEEDGWDIYDEEEDRKLKGHYLSDEMAETGEYYDEEESTEEFTLDE